VLNSAAVRSAARAAIVMPAVFAFADKVIGQPQTSLFAAFGSFAFSCSPRYEARGAPAWLRTSFSRASAPLSSPSTQFARGLRTSCVVRRAWNALVNYRSVPRPYIRDAEGGRRLLTCIREAAGGRDRATVNAALVLLWASQHLENLWLLEAHLANRANDARRSSTTEGAFGKLRILAS
jgi:hypothetical protein